MPIVGFPDPRQAGRSAIVAVGGDLHPASLLLAYRQGIFPWPDPQVPAMIWACPPERAILEFARLHVPRRLARERRTSAFRFTIDAAFEPVVAACAQVPRAEGGTWITPEMVRAYAEFHRLGYAHSVECWDGDELAGGLYGVEVDGAFAGESMFHRKANASKLALLALVDHLAARGLDWIDIQMLTPHFAALGARAIPRDAFLAKLQETRSRGLRLF